MAPGKLLVQAIMLAIVIGVGRILHWPWWGVTVAMVGAAIAFNLALELPGSGSRHLGAAAIATDDPLMVAALEQAQRTWGTFLRLYPDHPDTTIVKFRLRTKSGDIENVWGDLLELRDDQATVLLRTPPVGDSAPREPRMTIPTSDLVDWQIMFPDSTLRGGFTQQATFRIIERNHGSLPPKFVEQLARYRDVEGQPV
jgi:hypothetical protein